MNNKISEGPCIYYDALLNESKFRKLKKKEKKIIEDTPSPKKNQRQKKPNLNKQYFPSPKLGQDDSSLDSKVTEKIKNISRSGVKGVRPKLSHKSTSLSQRSTKKQLCNQISKLEQALSNKNRALIKFHSPLRIKQIQVMELYRVINFYEGKIKHLEQQIKRYEEVLQKIGRQCDQKSRHKSEVQQMVLIFQQMRKQNTELSAKIEQKDYTIGNLQQKAHKLQIKLNFMTSKQSFLKKSTSRMVDSVNSSKSKMSPSLNSSNHLSSAISVLNLKQKQENYGNIQSKINKIEVSLNFLKKENQILYAQIQEKQEKIFQMEKELLKYQLSNESTKLKDEQHKIPLIKKKQSSIIRLKNQTNEQNTQKSPVFESKVQKYYKEDPLNKTTVLPMLQKINEPSPIVSKTNKESQIRDDQQSFIQNQSQQSFASRSSLQSLIQRTKTTLHTQTFQKLKYQLLTQQVSFQQLVKFLANEQLQPELLEEPPYNLTTQQSQHLVEWISQLNQVCSMKQYNIEDILKAVIPKYQNITYRKQNTLKIQIANEFLNREKQFDEAIQGKDKICPNQMEGHLKEWGLQQEHLDALGKSYYEQTGQVQLTQAKILRSIIEKWASK